MNSIIEKINRGLDLPKGMKILHTSPHHDDEMLAYYPIMQELIANNQNVFAYITSGHHSVTDDYMFKALYAVPEHSIEFPPEKGSFLDAVAIVFGLPDLYSLREKVRWLKTVYFPNKIPGEHDSAEVSILKGSIRELEAEKMLSQLGVSPLNVHHLRAQFYDGGDQDADVLAFKSFIEQVKPDIMTVAFDPKDIGPKTHFHSLQVIMRALELSNVKPKIWNYRNVWSCFSIEEADLFIPVSEEGMESMNKAFMSCFQTQTIAAFPSQDFKGPFSKLAEKFQRDQFNQLKKVLGTDFFKNHPDQRVRNAKGFIFIQTTSL
jgi:glucosamine-6-phosphate deaminase